MQYFSIIIQLLASYLCLHIYLGVRTRVSKAWAFFITLGGVVLGESYILLNITEYLLKIRFPKWIYVISFCFMVISFYFIILYIITDFLRLIRAYPKQLKQSRFKEFVMIVVISVLVTSYGFYNGVNTKFKEVFIYADKPNIDFNVVFVSDLHIGSYGLSKNRLEEAVTMINEQDVDIVILGGDIVDRFVGAIYAGKYDESLKKIKAKYGVYAVLGNHEYYRNRIDNVENIYKNLGMIVLRDEVINVEGLNIDIIGLDDKTKPYFGLGKLKQIKELVAGNKFKILVSHNPLRQQEAVDNEVDLFLAGHTHAGQLYPLQIVLKLMYDTVWGYDVFNNTQVYVSSGLGTWGPPVRIGNDSEIILLKVKSK